MIGHAVSLELNSIAAHFFPQRRFLHWVYCIVMALFSHDESHAWQSIPGTSLSYELGTQSSIFPDEIRVYFKSAYSVDVRIKYLHPGYDVDPVSDPISLWPHFLRWKHHRTY
jgi:hypothetical protein